MGFLIVIKSYFPVIALLHLLTEKEQRMANFFIAQLLRFDQVA